MRRKINPWLLVMVAAPLCLLVLPFLPRGSGKIQAPSSNFLCGIFESLFYLVAVGGGVGLLVRSAWGATWEQVRRFVGAVCIVLALDSLGLITTIVLAPLSVIGFAGFLLLGLALIGKQRQ